MPEKSKGKGDALQEGRLRRVLNVLSLEEGDFTKEDIEAAVKRAVEIVAAEYGRDIATLNDEVKNLRTENDEYKVGFSEVEKTKRTIAAEKLAGSEKGKKINLTADFILKHGPEKVTDMEAFVDGLVEQFSPKGEPKGEGEKPPVPPATPPAPAPDSLISAGAIGEPSMEQLDEMPVEQYKAWRNKQTKK